MMICSVLDQCTTEETHQRGNRNTHTHLVEMAFDDLSDLEAASDALLEAAGVLGKSNGVYTETQLTRKMRLEQERIAQTEECGVPQDVLDYLAQLRIDELMELSGLTPMQEICFRLTIAGLSTRDLAATLGLKHQSITTHLKRAKKKVRAVYKQGRYAGWYEVYLSEVNRHKRG